ALAQHRVDRTALDLVVAGADLPLLVGPGGGRVGRQVVALRPQLGDGRLALGHRGADVGQLADVGLRRAGELTQLGQGVLDPLLRRQPVGERGQDAAGEGDVLGLHLHPRGRGERLDDRQQRVGRQHRRLVGQGVDDAGHAVGSPRLSARPGRQAPGRRPGYRGPVCRSPGRLLPSPARHLEPPPRVKDPHVSTTPVKVAVTGAAGQIGYSLLFRIAAGDLLGPETPVQLRLLEITPALKALEGVVMELEDCAFPLLAGVDTGDDPNTIFDGANVALLVGARPRTAGMERGDLLEANGAIFTGQGRALNDHAADDIRITVTGNPANTNALIAINNAPDIPRERFSALTRLDHNRALAQLSRKLGRPVTDVRRMSIWGNHSATQYPDLFHCEVDGSTAADLVERDWLENDFIPTVAKRGAAIIEARGASSAASAASATIDHTRDWLRGTPEGDWVSMAVCSDGSYGIPEGLISSFPVTTSGGDWSIVQGLEIDDFSRARIDASVAELEDERRAVTELGLI